MAKYEIQLCTCASDLVSYLDNGIRSTELSPSPIDSSVQRIGSAVVWLFVYDKFNVPNSSHAFLTLQIASIGDDVRVFAIGSGAEANLVSVVENLIDKYTQKTINKNQGETKL